MGRLEKKIDQDLVDRILAGWKPKKGESKSRGRNAKPRTKQYRNMIDGSFHGAIRLNRSKKWKRASSYAEARAQRMPIAAE